MTTEKRTKIIPIRVTESEKSRIESNANPMPTSEFGRNLMLGNRFERVEMILPPELDRLDKKLSGGLNNLNQQTTVNNAALKKGLIDLPTYLKYLEVMVSVEQEIKHGRKELREILEALKSNAL